MQQAQFGVIGLGVMGENLARNFLSRGYTLAVFDREISRVNKFTQAHEGSVLGSSSLSDFCANLERPRKMLMMVPAGAIVDNVIEQLLPYLEVGDIVIDGGNSHFEDSNRRYQELERKGILFVGAGVSGGEEGALRGPSIMPGGAKAAWNLVREPLQAIAAKVGEDESIPCCDWIGAGGSGHFVKMVHNGIEYGDMQIICEAYHLLKVGYGMSNTEISEVFARWNQGSLHSFLIEITADILGKRDAQGNDVLETILDAAGQKGTGKWTAVLALELGIPVTLIAEAVFARCLSAQKDERVRAAAVFAAPVRAKAADAEKQEIIAKLEKALFAAKIVSYAQGFAMLRAASDEYKWDIDYATIAQLWRGGCIIRSSFLENISSAFAKNPQLENLMVDEFFATQLKEAEAGWREVVMAGVKAAIPLPALSSALSYFDGYRCERLPANLLQAQRDYFGAHTYERVDRPRGEFFHTNWAALSK